MDNNGPDGTNGAPLPPPPPPTTQSTPDSDTVSE